MANQKKVLREVPLDRVRGLIAAKLDEMNFDMAAVSKLMGHNHAYLQQYIRYNVPQKGLSEADRHALAMILQVPPDDLRASPAPVAFAYAEAEDLGPPNVRPAPNVRLERASKRPQDVPVRGVVRGGRDGSFELNMGEAIDYVRRPVSMIGRGAIYALHIEGDSMAPRYEPGESILVYENRPALIGRDVVVQVRPKVDGDNPSAYLKRLVKRDDKVLVLEQFNPRKSITIKAADVLTVHMVLTRDEMI